MKMQSSVHGIYDSKTNNYIFLELPNIKHTFDFIKKLKKNHVALSLRLLVKKEKQFCQDFTCR